MGTFNPDQFLNQTVDGSFATRMTPVPEGEYIAVIDNLKLRATDANVILDVVWSLLDDAIKAKMDMKKVTVRQSVFLDLDDSGRLSRDPNKNIQLGRVREALGQNGPSAWGILMLRGAGPAKIKVGQRADKADATILYNDVSAVTKM